MALDARALTRTARLVLADLDLDAVLPRIVDAAQQMTDATYGALGVLDATGSALERFVTRGVAPEAAQEIGPRPTGQGLLGELIRRPQPLRITDVSGHPHSYGYPIGHPPMTTFLGVPIFVDGRAYGNLYLTDKRSGEGFTEDDEDAAVALAELAGLAIDHARRFTRSGARRTDLEQTVAALEATIEISRALGGHTQPEPLLALIAKRGRALVSARALIIEYVQGGELVVATGAGELPGGLVGTRVNLSDSVAAAALRTRHSLRLEDEPNRLRFERHGLGRAGLRASAGLVVPLIFRARALGALVAVDRLENGPAFTLDDQRLLEAFAASAATAVATAEDEERRSAVRLALATALETGSPAELRRVVGEAVDQLDRLAEPGRNADPEDVAQRAGDSATTG